MPKLLRFLLLIGLLCLTSQAYSDSDLDDVPRMGMDEFKTRHAENALYVIDVRYRGEYEAGHIPGSVLIPLQLLSSHIAQLREVGQPIVTYCQ